MKRTLVGILAISSGFTTLGADEVKMWGCSVGGTPGNAVVLVSGGSRSYVRLGAQRVPAQMTEAEGKLRWVWGGNSIGLDETGVALYYEGGDTETPKGTFRCRPLG